MGNERRLEEIRKQKEVAEWLQKSVQQKKTRMHKIVEEQESELKQRAIRERAAIESQKQ